MPQEKVQDDEVCIMSTSTESIIQCSPFDLKLSFLSPPAILGILKAKGPGKRGHIVADTLLPMMFLGLRKLGNICCEHNMFLNKIRNIFVFRTQNLCPQQMLRARANGETFVSATMCPRLPGPLRVSNCTFFIFDSELQDSLSFGFPEYSVRSEMMTYLSEHQNST